MKRAFFGLICFLSVLGCGDGGSTKFIREYGRQAGEKIKDSTSIEWETTFQELGISKRGPDIDVEFPFKNTGNSPLVVDSVMTSCGCTLVSIPEKPIKPGKKGAITVRFMSSAQPLAILVRHVFVKANTTGSPYHTLGFKIELSNRL